MLKAHMQRRHDEEGFTLIELMVVVLIIGILIAIALPTFLGARGRAQDKAAQSSLRNGLAAAKTCFTDNATYTGCDDTKLQPMETSLQFVTTASTGPTVVSVSNSPASLVFYAASLSASGTCWAIKDDTSVPGQGTRYANVGTTAATCAANNAAVTGATYNPTF